MRVKIFDMIEPLPKSIDTHAIAIIRPWINAGNVGSMILEELITRFSGKSIGKIIILIRQTLINRTINVIVW